MGVDHGGADITVAQQLLDGANVGSRLEQVCCKTVPQGVHRNRLEDSSFFDRVFDSPLQSFFRDGVFAQRRCGDQSKMLAMETPRTIPRCVRSGDTFAQVQRASQRHRVALADQPPIGCVQPAPEHAVRVPATLAA